MRIGLALLSLALVGSCGGQPVGGKVPAASPAKVAGVAAAAAAIVTIADPDAARQRQENRGGERESKGKKVKETVPEGVLFPPQAKEQDNAKKKPPCKKLAAPAKSDDEGSVELFPRKASDGADAREACKDDDKSNELKKPGDERKPGDDEPAGKEQP